MTCSLRLSKAIPFDLAIFITVICGILEFMFCLVLVLVALSCNCVAAFFHFVVDLMRVLIFLMCSENKQEDTLHQIFDQGSCRFCSLREENH